MLILGIIFAIVTIAIYLLYNGRLTPGLCLMASWTFVYIVQGIFARDMYFSAIAGFIVGVFCAAFLFGEYFGLGGSFGGSEYVNTKIPHRSLVFPPQFQRSLSIIICIVGLYAMIAIVNYYFLLKGFSSGADDSILIPGVREAIFADEIRLPGYIRIGITLAYVGVMFVLVYWILFGWKWYLIFPIISVVLFGFSQSGRAGTIIIMLQGFAAMYFRDVFFHRENPVQRFAYRTLTLLAITLAVFLGGQILREGGEGGLDDLLRIFAQLRAYLFGGVSAFSYYVDYWMVDSRLSLGRYTFSSLFQALGLFAQAPGVYDEYAPISTMGETTNLYTAFRSLIDDFKIPGCILFCIGAGYSSGRFFAGAVRGNVSNFAPLISFYAWTLFSPLFSLTYFNSFLAAMILPWACIAYLLRAKRHPV